MPSFAYLVHRAVRVDRKALRGTVELLHQKTGKPRGWLLTDMARCARRYGAGYVDYKIAEMYRLTDAQRETVITRAKSNEIVSRMNDRAFWHFFDNKCEFNRLFASQVGREWLDLTRATEAEFAAFLSGRGPIIAKPVDGSSGQGIEKCEPGEYGDPAALFIRLKADGIGIVEDCVAQHPVLSGLCPASVNTIRVATLLGDKQEGIVYARVRIGNGRVMDNVDCGGMAAPIDLSTGILSGPGADKAGHVYENHPLTGTRIPGTKLPYWEEVKQMCLSAMRVVPQVRYVAWDVAIREDGPIFIEGNSFPSHAIPQFAAHFPDGIGILPRFREFIDI